MNFNVYVDDGTAKKLTAAARGKKIPRNALVRRAIATWLAGDASGWPSVVLDFEGDPALMPFEARRAELAAAVEDPFAPPPRLPAKGRRRRS